MNKKLKNTVPLTSKAFDGPLGSKVFHRNPGFSFENPGCIMILKKQSEASLCCWDTIKFLF